MSKISKICFGISLLFLIGAGVTRILYANFGPQVYSPLAVGGALFVAALVMDYRLYLNFFTLKTTKHGLNMGWLIVMALVSVFVVNFLAVKYEKKWDLTKEGINTLSEQSLKVVSSLKADVSIVLLYSKLEQGEQARKQVADLVQLYHETSPRIKFESYAVLSRPDLAQKYEFKSGQLGLFAEYQTKHLKINTVSEEGITNTLLKLTKDQVNRKTIYFTSGHGERELAGEKADGLSTFKADLEITYNVKDLNLVNANIPADAAALIILGPHQNFFAAEIVKIKEYAKVGGHVLIAADPGEKHNIDQIDQMFGVTFNNDYVLDSRVRAGDIGPIIALGNVHSKTSDIVKSTEPQAFLLASSLTKLNSIPADYKIEELIMTGPETSAVAKLEQNPKVTSTGPHVIVVKSTGHIENSAKEFSAIIVGDSDFASNQLYGQYGNRDFLMNAVSHLAKDDELVTIRAKTPKATKIDAMGTYKNFLAVILLITPLLMIFSSGVIWWRRRTA